MVKEFRRKGPGTAMAFYGPFPSWRRWLRKGSGARRSMKLISSDEPETGGLREKASTTPSEGHEPLLIQHFSIVAIFD